MPSAKCDRLLDTTCDGSFLKFVALRSFTIVAFLNPVRSVVKRDTSDDTKVSVRPTEENLDRANGLPICVISLWESFLISVLSESLKWYF